MSLVAPFERSSREPSSEPRITESVLGEVVEVQSPPQPGQVQVRLYHCDGPTGQDGPIWARVAFPLAGANRGMFMLPDKGDEVLVTFIGGDPRFPVVVGSLWNGRDAPTERIGERGVDRWSFRSKDGSKISVVEETSGNAVLKLEVPGGVTAELKQSGGGKLELKTTGSTVTIEPSGVTVRTSGQVSVRGSEITLSASSVTVNAPTADFSGVVQARTVIANAIVGTLYTPGAGNIW
jgi:uncharacterized protein involved in type VI secretion and phage assembly